MRAHTPQHTPIARVLERRYYRWSRDEDAAARRAVILRNLGSAAVARGARRVSRERDCIRAFLQPCVRTHTHIHTRAHGSAGACVTRDIFHFESRRLRFLALH
jgi:hypothetical protein